MEYFDSPSLSRPVTPDHAGTLPMRSYFMATAIGPQLNRKHRFCRCTI